jgi:hypothetical protein
MPVVNFSGYAGSFHTKRGGSSSPASVEARKWRGEGFARNWLARQLERRLMIIRRNTTRSPPGPR